MRVFSINSVPYGSTGEVMFGIAKQVEENGGTALCATGFPRKPFQSKGWIRIAGFGDHALHALLSRLTGRSGCFSKRATRRLLKTVKAFSPDVIHLHNLHGWYIHLPLLFSFLKENRIPVVWTLHDCWAFTGQCPYYLVSGCEKWKTGCHHCSAFREYPASYVDATKSMWRLKREWFTGVSDLSIVTPSRWLAGQVEQSYLRKYRRHVFPNGIDLSIFQPTKSDFRQRYGLENTYIVLGVSFAWGFRKGLDMMIRLAQNLPKTYRVVLVGTNETVEKQLPKEILSIRRTFDRTELAAIYTAADVFVNPTREDNFPTVNMEAMACGTPVLTSDAGGSAEMVDASCGCVVTGDETVYLQEVMRICEKAPYQKENCVKKAKEFDKNLAFERYCSLYSELTENASLSGSTEK